MAADFHYYPLPVAGLSGGLVIAAGDIYAVAQPTAPLAWGMNGSGRLRRTETLKTAPVSSVGCRSSATPG